MAVLKLLKSVELPSTRCPPLTGCPLGLGPLFEFEPQASSTPGTLTSSAAKAAAPPVLLRKSRRDQPARIRSKRSNPSSTRSSSCQPVVCATQTSLNHGLWFHCENGPNLMLWTRLFYAHTYWLRTRGAVCRSTPRISCILK